MAGGGPRYARQYHVPGLIIGVYALGLHNKITTNWLQRTYSSLVTYSLNNVRFCGPACRRL